jgi:hypothetical protein
MPACVRTWQDEAVFVRERVSVAALAQVEIQGPTHGDRVPATHICDFSLF